MDSGTDAIITASTIGLGSLFSSIGRGITGLFGRGVVVDAGAATEAGTVTVGRWMSQAEYKAMVVTGRVQESIGMKGATYVANPADATAFLNQAKSGAIYVEFDVAASSVTQTSGVWARIIGPNTIESRLLASKGLQPITEMPAATNISLKATKLSF